jgi:hypothetical protein
VDKQRLTAPAARRWTQANDYVEAFGRRGRRSFRQRHRPSERTEPETQRLLLSTIPFLALLAALAVLSAAIIVTAWRGQDAQPAASPLPQHERGVAQRGWFEEARKQFR